MTNQHRTGDARQALEEIVELSRLDCGCRPCTGACYDTESLREVVAAIHASARAALAQPQGEQKDSDSYGSNGECPICGEIPCKPGCQDGSEIL